MNFDIAIIGGGPAGYTAAERAGANGLKAVLFEKKAIGGVCLNEGCIPTKTLLYSAKILDSIKNASKYGVFAESPSFDLSKIMSRKDKTVKMLTGGVKMTVNSYGVTIVEKEAFVEGEENGLIRIVCDGEAYFVKYLLVCTGVLDIACFACCLKILLEKVFLQQLDYADFKEFFGNYTNLKLLNKLEKQGGVA